MSEEKTPHGVLGPLAGFAGRWAGGGEGHYPTIDDFAYEEEIDFSWDGRPFLTYLSRTWAPGRARPMHTETGFLRAVGGGEAELLVTQPTGFTEIHRGPAESGGPGDAVFAPEQLHIAGSPDAKPVHGVRRRFTVDGDTLTYELWMAHADTPMTHHLSAALHRRG
ncbi:FABP family protein [Tomitella fengzijianii]|uniref:Peroxynitrite isomerase n=1 Tax=Tomitella fengzijianii TaxID=2597660 RepID=A0A516X1V4_9ACTN|nr:FABP family protein [Tomitella fengzijianii]QDQ96601.1 FABP family protein [Tomitella fengzijianii]